jgi:hypothetical protein
MAAPRAGLTHRQRATLATLAGLAAMPFIFNYAHTAFQPFILKGGYSAGLAWIALTASYYTMARSMLDVVRDIIDLGGAHYETKAGDRELINRSRKKTPPFDCLKIPDAARDFSTWQYLAFGWAFVEVAIGWIAFAGLFYAVFRSPYLTGLRPPALPQSGTAGAAAWLVLKLSSFLTYFSLYSIGLRWELGITPLVQRCLGAPDTYPGQNIFPRSVNELSLRLIGRPL